MTMATTATMTLSLRCEGMVADLLAEGYALAGASLAMLSQLSVNSLVSSLRAKILNPSDGKQITCRCPTRIISLDYTPSPVIRQGAGRDVL